MIHLEILIEEESMQELLKVVLEKMGIKAENYRLHVHHGKTNFMKKLPKLLRAYSNWIPDNYRILILIDQDNDDCYQLKNQIVDMITEVNLRKKAKVRIVVRMLEAWFFGEPSALEQAFPKLRKLNIGAKETYRNPESRPDPARDLDRELKEIGETTGYMKTSHSKKIARYLSLDKNSCQSFNITVQALQDLTKQKGESN